MAVDSYTIKVRKAKVIGVYPLIATGGHAIKRASMDGTSIPFMADVS